MIGDGSFKNEEGTDAPRKYFPGNRCCQFPFILTEFAKVCCNSFRTTFARGSILYSHFCIVKDSTTGLTHGISEVRHLACGEGGGVRGKGIDHGADVEAESHLVLYEAWLLYDRSISGSQEPSSFTSD